MGQVQIEFICVPKLFENHLNPLNRNIIGEL